ncbi:MAG: hypothetical protein FJ293_04225 [Planctomycetes bacterium]|nr:hypothetical protein [Planctomycetota bacterium]
MTPDVPAATELLATARARLVACEQWQGRLLRTVEFAAPAGNVARRQYVVAVASSRPLGALRLQWSERSESLGGLLVQERGREMVVLLGDEVASWPLGAEKAWRCSSLAAALAEDAGGGAALIASLLRPEEYAGASLLGEVADGGAAAVAATVEGVACWRVALTRALDGSGSVAQTAWFTQATLAPRMLVETQSLGGGTIVTTTMVEEVAAREPPGDRAAFVVAPPADALRVALWGNEVASGVAAAGAFSVAAVALAVALLLRRRRRA